MIEGLPTFVNTVFILTTLLTFWFFYKANHQSKTITIILFIWLAVQAILSYTLFYINTNTLPPRFLLLPLPPLLVIIMLFFTPKGKIFIASLDEEWLTWLHVVRIPVELALYWLFLNKQVPQLMTFAGSNFDILAGITAPVIAYTAYHSFTLNKKTILIWNIISLLLLINIVVHAVLSIPTSFQQFAFDQPNVGLLHFPFVWLPSFIVPLVLLSHLTIIYKIIKKK